MNKISKMTIRSFIQSRPSTGAITLFTVALFLIAGFMPGLLTFAGNVPTGRSDLIADGDLDTTFSQDGKATANHGFNTGSPTRDRTHDVAVQSNGRIIVAGSAVASGSPNPAALRFNADGTVDNGWATPQGNFGTFSGVGGEVRGIAVQPDDKVVLRVEDTYQGPGPTFANDAVIRLTANGFLDTTFGTNGVFAANAFLPNGISAQMDDGAIAIQPDGKIVLVGKRTNGAGSDWVMIRLTAGGTLDSSFGSNGEVVTDFEPGPQGDVASTFRIAFQPDAKIVVCGGAGGLTFSSNTSASFAVARYHPDGTLDNTFDNDGRTTISFTAPFASAESVAVQPDGKIVLGGHASTSVPGGAESALARLMPDGSLDTTFGNGGRVYTPGGGADAITSIHLRGDKIVATGRGFDGGNTIAFRVARYDNSGSLDTTFGTGGIIHTDFSAGSDFAAASVFQPDGKLVVAGTTEPTISTGDFAVARYDFAAGGTPTPTATPTATPTSTATPTTTPTATPNPDARPAMLTTGDASRAIVTYSDPVGSPSSQSLVPGLPSNASPHGIAYAGNNTALIGDFNNSRIFVVRTSDSALLSTMNTSAAGYNGSGTIAVPPQQNVALAIGSSSLKVIQAPFNESSTITSVTLPGSVQVFQTQAIVFNSEGRAFVRHSTGISVLDAPYTSVAFTIPISTGLRAAIAITPDGNTLLATGSNGITSGVFIINSPFSSTSTPQILTTIGTANGLKVTPDGTKAIVVSFDNHAAAAISAPFTPTSNIQLLSLPAGSAGFEHVDISPDGRAAILAGRSADEPPVLIRAPFTAAGAQSSNLPVNADNPNRGGGAVVFIPPATTPGDAKYDFDGDGRSDLSGFRPMADPTDNHWYILRSSDGSSYRDEWGIATDTLAAEDYDRDNRADLAVWRDEPGDPDRATFYILNSSDNLTRIEQFGRTGDVPLAGDWDGDGRADPAVYREGGHSFFFYRPSAQAGVDFVPVQWGITGDKPVLGDFDGDGKLDPTVFRPSEGIWYILQSSNGEPRYESWGIGTDTLVAADYDGDGKTDVAVFRDGIWYIRQSSNSAARYEQFGTNDDTLVPADYDGDGRTDISVYRGGVWYMQQSTAGFAAYNFGLATDRPVPDIEN